MDIRVQNTKARLREGLLSLMETTPLTQLTTQDIIDAAQVSRKTFYTYYKDKQALLSDLEQQILRDLKAALASDRAVLTRLDHTPTAAEIDALAQDSFRQTVHLISQHRPAGRVLLADHGSLNLMLKIQQIAIQEFRHRAPYLLDLMQREPAPTTNQFPVDYVVVLYVGAVMNILIHWVRSAHPIAEAEVLSLLGAVQIYSPLAIAKRVNPAAV